MNSSNTRTTVVEVGDWVDLWAQCYSDRYKDVLYDEYTPKLAAATDEGEFQSAILKLFEWKNGTPLSPKKMRSVKKIRWTTWQKWKTSGEIPSHFSGSIWNLFLVHLATNGSRPIFDQHTWRAYCFLTSPNDLTNKNPLDKCSVASQLEYFAEYERWFAKLISTIDARQLDRALMAFGQFLKSQFKPLLSQFAIPELTA